MPFEWSEHAPQILTLFRPWQIGDGYTQTHLARAEASLGFRLPELLRRYYAAWGLRLDMNQVHDSLLDPDTLFVLSDSLVFCAENQGAAYWAIPRTALNEPDPPVQVAEVYGTLPDGQGTIEAWLSSHPRLSLFLDEFTRKHAMLGGAVHGGVSQEMTTEMAPAAWLEEYYWQPVAVTPMFWSLPPDGGFAVPDVYIREGQALCWWRQCRVATQIAEDLDRIATELHIAWERRW